MFIVLSPAFREKTCRTQTQRESLSKSLSVVFAALKAFHLCKRKIRGMPSSTKLSGKSQWETRRDDTVGTRTTMTCLNVPGMLVFPGCCGCIVPPLRWDRIMFGTRWLNKLLHVCVGVCLRGSNASWMKWKNVVQLCPHSTCRWFIGYEVKSCFFNVSAEYQLINSEQV